MKQYFQAVAMIAICSTAASAKDQGPRADEVRQLVSDYATCIVRHSHDQAAKALLGDSDNLAIKQDFRRLINGDCLRPDVEEIEFGSDLYRYALADALVNAEFAKGGPSDFSDRPPLMNHPGPTQAEIDAAVAAAKSDKKRVAIREAYEEQRIVPALSQYGECVVRLDPADARLWILAKPGSPEEASRIDTLRPSFAACLKEGTVAFSKATLRGTVALNYYQLAHAPVQPIPVNAN
jgi:hypothetical protein